MRRIIGTLVVALTLVSASASAAWTEEEQSLIDQIKVCWDAWIEGGKRGGADLYFKKCPVDDNYSMWWSERGAPESNFTVRQLWDYFADLDEDWVDIRPVAITMWGDSAMVQFYGYWMAKTPDGPTVTEYKRTEVYRRDDRGWVLMGGQGTPATARDADPYN